MVYLHGAAIWEWNSVTLANLVATFYNVDLWNLNGFCLHMAMHRRQQFESFYAACS